MHLSDLRARLTSLAALLAVCTGACSLAAAQTPPAWTVLDVPGGVQASGVQQIGKIITYVDNGQVWAYSAFAHEWVSIPASPAASVRVANDLALVVDGTSYHAFASYTGAWDTISLGASAVVVNPTSQRNDSIWLILDGGTLWAFTAFHGRWIQLPVGAAAAIQTERHVAIVVDGTVAHGLSAMRDAWVSTTLPAAPNAWRARGTAAVAASSAGLAGFSALANAWSTAAAPGSNPQISLHDDVQVISDGSTYVGFSGLHGGFAPINLPGTITLTLGETLCHATDGASNWVYTAVRNTWSTLPSTTGALLTVGSNGLLLTLNDRVHAYSAMRDNVATALGSSPLTAMARSVASMHAGGGIKLYSAILGQWFDAPAGSAVEISDVAGFVHTASGIAAFSSRSGRFTPLATTPAATTVIAIGNAVQAVIDNNTLHVFDPRRERWMSGALQGTPQVGTHRTTLLVIDGTRAYGYGSFSSQLSAVDLPSSATIIRPNSESGSLDVANAIYAHSSVPDILTLWQYPEFRRVYVTGTPLELQVHAQNGTGFFFLGLRLLATPAPFGALGLLELDPSALVTLSGLPVPISQNRGTLTLAVPDLPSLRGLELSFQAVVLPTVGAPYLTQSASLSTF
ncbi:MAG: hypothetical protein R3F56_17835 [Planctomycetota bacterium]